MYLDLWHKKTPYTQFWYVWVCLGVLACFQFFQDPVISCIKPNQRPESESGRVLKYQTWMIIHNDSSDSGENWGPLFINLYTPQENCTVSSIKNGVFFQLVLFIFLGAN